MGEPDEVPPVDVRLLRTQDLVDLRLEAPGCTIELSSGAAELVADPDASLVLHFPPQHVGEEVWQAGAPPPPPAPPPRPSSHRPAGPTRLVYEVPAGTRIPYLLESVLGALPGLRLRVPPGATPSGEAGDRGFERPLDFETAIEAPYRLIVSPSARGAFPHDSWPKGPPDRVELWRTRLTVRTDDGDLDDDAADQRIVRDVWTRDSDLPAPAPGLTGDQLSADSPTREAAVRASRLQQSRTVRASVQSRPAGAGDLEWQTTSTSVLLAVSVEESGGFRATWAGSVVLPADAGTPAGEAAGLPGLRRPGGAEASWPVLVEEHELLDQDPADPNLPTRPVPRLVYADAVTL